MSEFEPFRANDCLRLVDAIRSVMSQRTPDGCLSPLGCNAVTACLDMLEVKLGGERRGPVNAPPR